MPKNEASKTRPLKIAFVVNAENLRRLDTVLGEASKELEYTVGFSDGTNVRYSDVEDIIKLPNSNEHAITSLIAGTPEDGNQTAFVTLRSADRESPTLEYTLSGPQGKVVYLGSQLDDWVAAIRQWYSFGRSSEVAGAAFAIIAFIGPALAWDKIFKFLLPTTVRTVSWVNLLAIILLYVAEFGIFKLFPRGIFATGRGLARHEFLIWLRRAVAALLASTVARIIVKLLIAK